VRLDSVRYQRYQETMSDDDTFNVPVPPPFGPPPHGDVIFFRHDVEAPPGKDHDDIMLRRVPRETAMRYRAAAGGRGLTHAQYLTALVELHARLRTRADEGDEPTRTLLDELGLASVTV
jgi:hypothetical protein